MNAETLDDIHSRPEVDYTRWVRDAMYHKTGLKVFLKKPLESPFPLTIQGFPIVLARSKEYTGVKECPKGGGG